MQAGTTLTGRYNLALWALIVFGAGLALVVLSLVDIGNDKPQTAVAPISGGRLAYFEFGVEADTLWLADPTHPEQREKAFVAPHASDFGVVPRLSPDGRRVAYNALPRDTKSPSAETPADLWVADASKDGSPHLVASKVDLPVPTAWSPDGSGVVFRRSNAVRPGAAGEHKLYGAAVDGGGEALLITAQTALFPVAFGKDGALLYVQLQPEGSELRALDVVGGSNWHLGWLSQGLTRDWTLSPDGQRVAYLSMGLSGAETASRAFVFDLTAGVSKPVVQDGDAFNPLWSPKGALAVGRPVNNAEAGGVGVSSIDTSGTRMLPGPAKGFDVPLAFRAGGEGLVVRSFDGSSATKPGRSSLAFVGPDGSRTTITTKEVTFLGWIP
jgi:WD40-like Beta Propeller Repeat